MHTELIKHQIAAYREREAAQRSAALAQAASGQPELAQASTRAADQSALKISQLQRRIADRCPTCPRTESTSLGLRVAGQWRCLYCYRADRT